VNNPSWNKSCIRSSWSRLMIINKRRIGPYFVISYYPSDEQFHIDYEIVFRMILYILFLINNIFGTGAESAHVRTRRVGKIFNSWGNFAWGTTFRAGKFP
jgi:hypothetical protein